MKQGLCLRVSSALTASPELTESESANVTWTCMQAWRHSKDFRGIHHA